MTAVALGKTALRQLSPADLVALDPVTADIAGVDLAYAATFPARGATESESESAYNSPGQ